MDGARRLKPCEAFFFYPLPKINDVENIKCELLCNFKGKKRGR